MLQETSGEQVDVLVQLRLAIMEGAGQLAEDAIKEIEHLRSLVGQHRWRHKKRRTTYTEVGRAELQSSMPLDEGDIMVVYRGDDGKLWVRPADEFDDGRFEEVT
jgi:hypothetical protein